MFISAGLFSHLVGGDEGEDRYAKSDALARTKRNRKQAKKARLTKKISKRVREREKRNMVADRDAILTQRAPVVSIVDDEGGIGDLVTVNSYDEWARGYNSRMSTDEYDKSLNGILDGIENVESVDSVEGERNGEFHSRLTAENLASLEGDDVVEDYDSAAEELNSEYEFYRYQIPEQAKDMLENEHWSSIPSLPNTLPQGSHVSHLGDKPVIIQKDADISGGHGDDEIIGDLGREELSGLYEDVRRYLPIISKHALKNPYWTEFSKLPPHLKRNENDDSDVEVGINLPPLEDRMFADGMRAKLPGKWKFKDRATEVRYRLAGKEQRLRREEEKRLGLEEEIKERWDDYRKIASTPRPPKKKRKKIRVWD